MQRMKLLLPFMGLAASGVVLAQETRVHVLLENLAPSNGTFQTPVWVGFHDGAFDLYDPGTLASSLPIAGSQAIESIAEDGNAGPLSADFATLGFGQTQGMLFGPGGPIAPGESASETFLLDAGAPSDRYFSYASMVIPSNDAFIANGNPVAHPVFDDLGNFIAEPFFVSGPGGVRDAGTEANDELPANTAFFGQMAPNTGVTTSMPIVQHPGFNPAGLGGILDDPRFRNGQFAHPGYPFVRVSFQASPAVTDFQLFQARIAGFNEVPVVQTDAFGLASAILLEGGTRLVVIVQTLGLEDLVAGHLHMALPGSNGPVVANLLMEPANPMGGADLFLAEINTGDLLGPLADFPLDELMHRMDLGRIYVNLHSSAHPNGEIRGQLLRIQ